MGISSFYHYTALQCSCYKGFPRGGCVGKKARTFAYTFSKYRCIMHVRALIHTPKKAYLAWNIRYGIYVHFFLTLIDKYEHINPQ